MTVIKAATKFVNSGQIPVVTIDQTLHRLIKMITCQLPATHGKDTFIVILGGLLIEICCFKWYSHKVTAATIYILAAGVYE